MEMLVPRGQLSDSCSESHPARWYVRKVAASRAESKQRQKSGCINTYFSLSVCLRIWVCVCVCVCALQTSEWGTKQKSQNRQVERRPEQTDQQQTKTTCGTSPPPSLYQSTLTSHMEQGRVKLANQLFIESVHWVWIRIRIKIKRTNGTNIRQIAALS